MAKKLTYNELCEKLTKAENELKEKEERIIGLEVERYTYEQIEHLRGKVEVYERLMSWVENYFRKMEGE